MKKLLFLFLLIQLIGCSIGQTEIPNSVENIVNQTTTETYEQKVERLAGPAKDNAIKDMFKLKHFVATNQKGESLELFNNTLGKVWGAVNNFNDVKKFTKDQVIKDYIKYISKKEEARIALELAAEEKVK